MEAGVVVVEQQLRRLQLEEIVGKATRLLWSVARPFERVEHLG